MVSLNELIQRYRTQASQTSDQALGQPPGTVQYYQCQRNVNIYDSPQCKDFATQAVTDRQLRILPLSLDAQGQISSAFAEVAIPVFLYEDDYPGWLALDDLDALQSIDRPSKIPVWTAEDIRDRIPQIIAYMKTAMAQPNEYLWGGVLGPNYDCSGLMQAAFRSQDIWLPRDAYQQEGFLQPVNLNALEVGDLIFFGPQERANHVALYLGNRHYIHSSGKAMGRNGIGLDVLPMDVFPDSSPNSLPNDISYLNPSENKPDRGDPISQAYAKLVHGAGRVVASYHPQGTPIKPLDAKVIYQE